MLVPLILALLKKTIVLHTNTFKKSLNQTNLPGTKFRSISRLSKQNNYLPTPQAARYKRAGAPKPPAPTTSIDDFNRFDCPTETRQQIRKTT